MSNFAADDIHRSLRRFVSLVLEAPWKVRTERQPVADSERPAMVIEPSSGITTGRHRVSIPQGNVEKVQAFSAMAYPVLEETARESRLTAQKLADLLDQAFTVGLVDDAGVSIGAPFRIPIYDFEDVPVAGRSRAGPSEPYGFAWVADLTVRAMQDPVDYLRFTVTCDLRLSWEQGGRLGQVGPLARDIAGTFTRSP